VVDLRTVLKEAADAVRPLMEARGVELRLEISAEPLWVDGDPARLQQVHVNLLGNAGKYTPRGGHVLLDAKLVDGHSVVTVRDNGMGMSKAMLETAFDLFVQSNRTLERSEGGLGVGLTLVRGLVVKHGGTVTARSEGEGKGCELVVRLPCAAPPVVITPTELLKTVPFRKGSRIVIVEDNADSLELLSMMLTRAGCECHGTNNGISGLELIEEVHPNVAIVDIGLPGIDGFEFARRVRGNANHAKLFLIAHTGYGQREDREKSLAAGFDAHLVKPVDFEALQQLLTQCPS